MIADHNRTKNTHPNPPKGRKLDNFFADYGIACMGMNKSSRSSPLHLRGPEWVFPTLLFPPFPLPKVKKVYFCNRELYIINILL